MSKQKRESERLVAVVFRLNDALNLANKFVYRCLLKTSKAGCSPGNVILHQSARRRASQQPSNSSDRTEPTDERPRSMLVRHDLLCVFSQLLRVVQFAKKFADTFGDSKKFFFFGFQILEFLATFDDSFLRFFPSLSLLSEETTLQTEMKPTSNS